MKTKAKKKAPARITDLADTAWAEFKLVTSTAWAKPPAGIKDLRAWLNAGSSRHGMCEEMQTVCAEKCNMKTTTQLSLRLDRRLAARLASLGSQGIRDILAAAMGSPDLAAVPPRGRPRSQPATKNGCHLGRKQK